MSNDFFDRLFSGKIMWTLHTAMTCDLAYVSALTEKQHGDRLKYNMELNCAFFYDGRKTSEPTCRMESPRFRVGGLEKYVHRLNAEKTHHAKISLVCYECENENEEKQAGFRLAVYSRNLEFSDSMDAAMLFELEKTEKETGSGAQLCAYLDKLYSAAEPAGKKWLKDHVAPYVDLLKQCVFKSEFGRGAELYFGGLANGTNLGRLLDLDSAGDRSLVLTPPVFIEGTCAEVFFKKTKRILYDSNDRPSHIKLYLLEKPAGYELWVGSANATKNGLGWDFSQTFSQGNIECLVKLDISRQEFDALWKDIAQGYDQYDFEKPGSLVVHPDNIGPYIVGNFQCAGIEYVHKDLGRPYKGAGTITVTLEKTGEAEPPKNMGNVSWRPLEYSETANSKAGVFDIETGARLTLTYPYEAFRESQGFLVFGSGCCMMRIDSDKLPADLPMKRDALIKDARLTDWLMREPNKIPNEDEKWDVELKWLRRVLCGVSERPVVNVVNQQSGVPDGSPDPSGADYAQRISGQAASSTDAGEAKATPMPFQKNGAERLSAILDEHSRAFLADEPGLGKTFTAALLIDKLSQKKCKLSQKKDKSPFFVLYIAPNLALLENNGRELVDKLGAVSNKKTVLLSEYATPKEALKNAYRAYYQSADKEEKLGDIINTIDEDFDFWEASSGDNSLTYVKKFVKTIRNMYRDESGRVIDTPDWNNSGRLLGYYKKSAVPDRLAYAYEVFEGVRNRNPEEFDGKIVIITVSAEVALGETSHSDRENQIIREVLKEHTGECGEPNRAEFTKKFLDRYGQDLIIWDEFHRYMNKLKADNPFFEAEKKGELKSLFVSATPYKTNISGGENNENKKAFDELYQAALDEESPDVTLPSFENDFAPLFCGGKHTLSAENVNEEDLKAAYAELTGKGDKSKLEPLLKERMIRNERTRLQGYYEEHIPLSQPATQYDDTHAEILRHTYEQCRLLKDAGYPDGALRWSMSMPWILCFSTDRTKSKSENGFTYFKLLDPEGKKPSEKLFVYEDGTGRPKENLLIRLPKYNLAMHQICERNIPRRRAAQLLWTPATMPLYQAGEKSIFTKYADYSKLLVFAEYRYLQRGGAILLSDYCNLLCKGNMPEDFNPRLSCKGIRDAGFPAGDYRERTLDELLDEMRVGSDVEKLYRLASPAACAERLGLDPEALTNAFNKYFNKAGVKEALWSWLSENKFDKPGSWEKGILRYCAEGNLYAVLKEWLFCMKEKDPDKRMAHISRVLGRQHSQVGVQTYSSSIQKDDGIPRSCGFAEQLTGDLTDVGRGEDAENTGDCCKAFNSPFYPMILFAGRGAQEGIDLHNYCLRIMHLTLPRGAVSYEQRNGRIDRYRSLLVRRRAAELVGTSGAKELAGVFKVLKSGSGNKLYPNWSIPNKESKWHFEELMPVWEYTEESCFADTVKEMLRTYRESMGVHDELGGGGSYIDLSTT